MNSRGICSCNLPRACCVYAAPLAAVLRTLVPGSAERDTDIPAQGDHGDRLVRFVGDEIPNRVGRGLVQPTGRWRKCDGPHSSRNEAPRAWSHRRATRPTSPRAGFRSSELGASNPPGTALATLSPSPLHQQNRGAADGMDHEM